MGQPPLDMLFSRGWINEAEYRAGLVYAAAAQPGGDAALAARLAVRLSAEGRRPRAVLDNIVVYQRPMRFMDSASRRPSAAWAADRRDLAALRRALGALAELVA